LLSGSTCQYEDGGNRYKPDKTRPYEDQEQHGIAWTSNDFCGLLGQLLSSTLFASGSSQVTEQEALTEVSYCGSRNCHDRPAITRQSPSCGVSWTLLLLKSNSIFDILYHPRVRP